MMMGFGPYGNRGGGGSSSSSSNLSALAPPFTVDRSVSKPLVDLSEPPLNWLNTHPFSFDSMHSSNAACGYSFRPPSTVRVETPEKTVPVTLTDSFVYAQNSDAITNSNLVEAKPYYPSYVSPTKYTYDDYAQSLSGLWDAPRAWEFSKKVDFGESFCSKEMNVPDSSTCQDYGNRETDFSTGVNTFKEVTNGINMLGSEQHQGSSNGEQLDYKSFPIRSSEFTPFEYPRKSVLGSTSLFPDPYSLSPCEQVWSRNNQASYGASHEKSARQHGISPNDVSAKSSSPRLIIKPQAVASSPSAFDTCSFNNLENGNSAENTNFVSNDSFSYTKEFYPLQNTEGKVYFDASQVSVHLEGGNLLENTEKFSSNVNVIKDPFREKSGLQDPDIGPGPFSLMLASNGAIGSLEGSSESLDHYNPAVDSPCWKGAPLYHSTLENPWPATPQFLNKIEACTSSNSIGPNGDSVKFSSQKPSDCSFYQENGCLVKDSEAFPKRISLANILFQEHGYDHDLETGSYPMKSSCGVGVQFSDFMDKPRQDCDSADEFKFKSFHFMQHNGVEDKLKEKCDLGTGVEDIRMTINDTSEGCSSHVPLHATEHVLSSPSSVEVGPAKITKLHSEESAPKMCVQTLISTVHNLSELLLFQCSNEVCELKEIDLENLKQVVNNLDKCISKRMGPGDPLHESLTRKGSQIIREFPEHHHGVSVSRPLETKAEFSVLNKSDCQHAQEEMISNITSAKKDERCLDYNSQVGDVESVKNDNMTQAIKKVLSDNFVQEEDEKLQILLYKNLWLEAEAALCSINYKARFDRMKNEMEKCKLLQAEEGTTEMERSSQSTFSPEPENINKLTTEVREDLTQDEVREDLTQDEVRDDPTQDGSVQGFPVTNTSSHPDDVISRFHVLKCRESKPNAERRPTADHIYKLWTSQTPTYSSSISGSTSNADGVESISNAADVESIRNAADVESSVISRFQILKKRIENSSCSDMEGQLLPQVPLKLFQFGILDENMEPELQQNSADHMQEMFTVKEIHPDVKDDTMNQSPKMNRPGNQIPASSYDSSFSDWEHVMEEEFPAGNC